VVVAALAVISTSAAASSSEKDVAEESLLSSDVYVTISYYEDGYRQTIQIKGVGENPQFSLKWVDAIPIGPWQVCGKWELTESNGKVTEINAEKIQIFSTNPDLEYRVRHAGMPEYHGILGDEWREFKHLKLVQIIVTIQVGYGLFEAKDIPR